jgi:hypothetical protein
MRSDHVNFTSMTNPPNFRTTYLGGVTLEVRGPASLGVGRSEAWLENKLET